MGNCGSGGHTEEVFKLCNKINEVPISTIDEFIFVEHKDDLDQFNFLKIVQKLIRLRFTFQPIETGNLLRKILATDRCDIMANTKESHWDLRDDSFFGVFGMLLPMLGTKMSAKADIKQPDSEQQQKSSPLDSTVFIAPNLFRIFLDYAITKPEVEKKLASLHLLHSILEKKNVEALKVFLDYSSPAVADLTSRAGEDENTALHVVCSRNFNSVECLRELISSGKITPEVAAIRNKEGYTPLALAAFEGTHEIVAELCANQIGDINHTVQSSKRNASVTTLNVLQVACSRLTAREDNCEIVGTLLTLPGSQEAKNAHAFSRGYQHNCLSLAIFSNDEKLLRLLVLNGVKDEVPEKTLDMKEQRFVPVRKTQWYQNHEKMRPVIDELFPPPSPREPRASSAKSPLVAEEEAI